MATEPMTLKKILTGGYKAFACRISGLYPSFWRRRRPEQSAEPGYEKEEHWRTVHVYKKLHRVLMVRMGLIAILSFNTMGYLYYNDHFLMSEYVWLMTMIFFSRSAIRTRLGTRVVWRINFSETTGQVKFFRCFNRKPITMFLQELDVEEVQAGCRFRFLPNNSFYFMPNIPSVKAESRETDIDTIANWIHRCKMCKPYSFLSFYS